MTTTEHDSLSDEALDAFWEVVRQRFPQARHGDLSPHRSFRLSLAAEEAIEEWIRSNVPPK